MMGARRRGLPRAAGALAALCVPASLLAQTAADGPGRRAVDTIPGTGVVLETAWVPGGTFLLGSPDDEPGRDEDEGPRRSVSVEPFWMGVHEVTHDAYALFRHRRLDGDEAAGGLPFDADAVTRPSPPYDDPAHGMGRDGHPAVGMTREAALRFARWLSFKTGRLWRLPTEAEWEWACRAGTDGPWSFPAAEADAHAWHDGNSDGAYHPVGTRAPNPWGLHDLHGNVAEWTSDPYSDDFYARLEDDAVTASPRSGDAGRGRGVVRGGAFDDALEALRCADRQPESTAWKRRDPQVPKSRWWNTDSPHVGFRLVRPAGERSPEEIRAWWDGVLGEG